MNKQIIVHLLIDSWREAVFNDFTLKVQNYLSEKSKWVVEGADVYTFPGV